MVNLKETTQVRLIQSEARAAIVQEREAMLGAVKSMVDEIKREMREHFATKLDVLEWQMKTNRELDELIRVHVVKDHKVASRASIVPKGRLSTTQRNSVIGAIVAILTAIAAYLKYRYG